MFIFVCHRDFESVNNRDISLLMISKTILIVCEGQRASEVVQARLFFLALYFHGYETLGARTGRVFANSALPLYTDMVEKYKKMVLVFVLVRHA